MKITIKRAFRSLAELEQNYLNNHVIAVKECFTVADALDFLDKNNVAWVEDYKFLIESFQENWDQISLGLIQDESERSEGSQE